MATYKGIKGGKVQTVTADPTASEAEAMVWYNTPADALKYSIQIAGSWAAGNNLNSARRQAAGAGIQTSALYASGGNGGTGSGTAETQGYNGSVFATQPTLASERGYGAGFGTAAASVAGGGLRSSGVATTEEFTGETTALNLKTITDS